MYTLLAMATHILGTLDSLAAELHQQQAGGTEMVRQIKIDGDLILGGLFPVHAKGLGANPCGQMWEGRGMHRVEAMLFALDRINNDDTILPGIKLGALILDSCSTPAYALNQSLDFVRDMIGTMDTDQYVCQDGSNPQALEDASQPVVGVIGGSYSSVSVQVANLLRLFHIVQISPASTNADLSDKTRFEYFARTVPSDNFQARAMVDICANFSWTYVSLVYSAEEYGELAADAFKKEARKQNLCIATEEKIAKREAIPESIENLVKKLQSEQQVGARVVVLFLRNDDVAPILREAHNISSRMRDKPIIWMASEAWDRNNPATTAGHEETAAGAIVLMLESKRVPEFDEYWLSLRPGTPHFERNAWLRELWETKFRCTFDAEREETVERRTAVDGKRRQKRPVCGPEHRMTSLNPDDKIQFVIDAVYAIAHALHQVWLDNCGSETLSKWISRATQPPQPCMALKHIDGDEFYKTYLLNVSFTNMVGNLFRFDAQGDGPAIYTILNYQPDLHNPFKNSIKNDVEADQSSRNDYKVVGRWHDGRLEINESKLFWRAEDPNNETQTPTPLSVCSLPCQVGFNKQLIKDEMCCWACAKCEPWEYLANETTCVECRLGWWPTPNRTECYDLAEKELKHMIWSSWYSVVPCILAIIGIICTIAVIIIYIRHNETPIVKASGRELSYILLGAIIVCYLMTFILLAKPTPLVCALKRTGVGFGFSVLYSAMLVKTNRIYRIFSQARMSAQRPSFISPVSQVVITVLLASVQLVASLIWLLIAHPGIRNHHPDRSQVVLTCSVEDQLFLVSLSYDALLIVLCTVYAVKTRKVPENFNEAKFIGFTMYTTCIIWLAFVPIYFGTGTDFQIQTTTLCISISMSANVALVCIFSPKLWIIVIEPDKNVRKQCGESMLTKRSTLAGTQDESTPPTQYSALLGDQRRRTSRAPSQPDNSSAAAARGSLTNSTFGSSPQTQTFEATAGGVLKRKRLPPNDTNTTGYESLEEESLTSV